MVESYCELSASSYTIPFYVEFFVQLTHWSNFISVKWKGTFDMMNP